MSWDGVFTTRHHLGTKNSTTLTTVDHTVYSRIVFFRFIIVHVAVVNAAVIRIVKLLPDHFFHFIFVIIIIIIILRRHRFQRLWQRRSTRLTIRTGEGMSIYYIITGFGMVQVVRCWWFRIGIGNGLTRKVVGRRTLQKVTRNGVF